MGRIGTFAIETVLWFLFWLAVWYVSCNLLMAPVYLLVKWAVAALFPSWADKVLWIGHDFMLSTTLHLGSVTGRAATLAVKANFLTYGVGWPLTVALLLASDADRIVPKVLLATVILWVPQSAGVVVEFLHAVYVQSGLLPLGDAMRDLVIVLFQFLIMVTPALMAVVLWLWLEERFVRSLVVPALTTRSPSDVVDAT